MSSAERVGELLLAQGWKIAVAESTAGGLISAALLTVPGASRYYERGVIAYSRAAKLDTLGMPPGSTPSAGRPIRRRCTPWRGRAAYQRDAGRGGRKWRGGPGCWPVGVAHRCRVGLGRHA
jgi:hypothetical protein